MHRQMEREGYQGGFGDTRRHREREAPARRGLLGSPPRDRSPHVPSLLDGPSVDRRRQRAEEFVGGGQDNFVGGGDPNFMPGAVPKGKILP